MTAAGIGSRELPGSLVLALGIPLGVVHHRDRTSRSGVVRRGGETVFVDVDDYAAWAQLLVPRLRSRFGEAACDAVDRLRASRLIADIDSREAVAALRPVPLGTSLGNTPDAPDRFRVRRRTDSDVTVLDPIENLLWFEFDGLVTVSEAAANVSARVAHVAADRVLEFAVLLVLRLAAGRLVYLDAPAMSGG